MNDFCNGLFEMFGGLMLGLNVVKLYKDKEVKGVHWGAVAFFFSWGLWNLYYYPSLNQWWSFAGGCLIATMNLAWLSMLVFYSVKVHERKPWLCWIGIHDWAVLRSCGGYMGTLVVQDRVCLRCAKRDDQFKRRAAEEREQLERQQKAKELISATIDNNFR